MEIEILKKCTSLWREAHFEVKIYKMYQDRTSFGSYDVEKIYAVVGRNTFPNQNLPNTTCSRHFWKWRCRKSARHCGAKYIYIFPNQNKLNTTSSCHFWKLRCRKNIRRCGTKYISKFKYIKYHMFASLLEVKMSKNYTSLWREAHFEIKI